MSKSKLSLTSSPVLTLDMVGKSYYIFCMEQSLANIRQARVLLAGDIIDDNHELALIERKIVEAIEAS